MTITESSGCGSVLMQCRSLTLELQGWKAAASPADPSKHGERSQVAEDTGNKSSKHVIPDDRDHSAHQQRRDCRLCKSAESEWRVSEATGKEEGCRKPYRLGRHGCECRTNNSKGPDENEIQREIGDGTPECEPENGTFALAGHQTRCCNFAHERERKRPDKDGKSNCRWCIRLSERHVDQSCCEKESTNGNRYAESEGVCQCRLIQAAVCGISRGPPSERWKQALVICRAKIEQKADESV